MAFIEVDPNSIKLDSAPVSNGGFVEVDPNTIKLDAPETQPKPERTWANTAEDVWEGVGQAGVGTAQLLGELFRPIDTQSSFGRMANEKLDTFQAKTKQAIDKSRAAVAERGGEIPALIGNVVGAALVPGGGAAKAPGVVTQVASGFLPKIAAMTGYGAAQGSMAPLGENDSRATNAFIGAATAGTLQGLGSGVNAGVKATRSALAIDQQAAQELASQGFDVTRLATGSGSNGANFVRGYLRNTFIGGKMVEGAGKRAAEQGARAADDVLATIGKSMDAAGAGENLIKGLETGKRAFNTQKDALYNAADALIPQGFVKADNLKSALSSTQGVLEGSEVAKVLGNTPLGKMANDLQAALAKDQGAGRVDYSFLKQFRTSIGEQIDQSPFASPEQKFYRKAYAAISKDLESAAALGGEQAVKAMKAANDFYRTGRTEIEKQFMRFGGKGDAEAAFKALASPDLLRNAPERVTKLMERLPQGSRKVIGATLLRRLGQKVDGGEFDLQAFATGWGRMAPKARAAIAGSAENAAELEKLVRNIERVRPLIEAVPQTGQVAAGRGSDAAAALGVFYAPWLTAAKLGLDSGLGWLLTKPQNIRLLNMAAEKQNPAILQKAVQGMSAMASDGEIKTTLNSLKAKVGETATEAAPTISRKPSSVTLQSNPIVPAAMLAGGLGAANFASGLAVPNQGPAQDQWVTNRDSLQTQRMAQGMDESADLPRSRSPRMESEQMNAPAAGPTSAVDPIEQYLDRKMMVESGGRADAKAKTSSATGLFQYTTARWLEIAPKALGERVKGLSKRDLLLLREDAEASRIVARYDTLNELAPSLERIGVPITSTTLYLAHFLGETGAKRLLTAKVGTPVEKILDKDQIDANQSVLKGKKAEDVLRWAQDKMADYAPKPPKKKRERVRYSQAKQKVGVS